MKPTIILLEDAPLDGDVLPPESAQSTESLTVTLNVKASFDITVGLYAGPINRTVIAEHIDDILNSNSIEEWIDSWNITEVREDDATLLVETINE